MSPSLERPWPKSVPDAVRLAHPWVVSGYSVKSLTARGQRQLDSALVGLFVGDYQPAIDYLSGRINQLANDIGESLLLAAYLSSDLASLNRAVTGLKMLQRNPAQLR